MPLPPLREDEVPADVYLKALGSAEGRMPDFWVRDDPKALVRVGFPRRPRIEKGDVLVYYFAGWQTIVGVVGVLGGPRKNPSEIGSRWPWIVRVYPWLVVPYASDGVRLRDVGISTLSVRSQSHIRLDHATYRRVLAALANEQALDGERYYPGLPDWTVAAA
jgi:hypothetical protein